MAEMILRAEGLGKALSGRTLFAGLDLCLGRGEAAAVLGPEGAGKTSLLRILAGQSAPDAGRVSLFGAETERELRAARRRMGFLIGEPLYFGGRSVEANLRLRAGLYGPADGAWIRELSERLRLRPGDVGEGKSSLLKQGQKGRFALALALASRPELLLLDGPFALLDPEDAGPVAAFLEELRRGGMAILFTERSGAALPEGFGADTLLRLGEGDSFEF